MPKFPVTLIKGDTIGAETDYRDALPMNMYAVDKAILGASGYMRSYPGLTLLCSGEGVDRGAHYNERFGTQYRLSGDKLISIDSLGNTTVLGTVPGSSQGRLSDFYSFNTQGVIADGRMFLYAVSSGFREVTDPDLGSPIDGVWVDGYYFLTDGEYIYHTDIDDEAAIDPLKFATAEFMPDPSLAVAKTQDNKILVFGRYTLEYFVNAATVDFAFQRINTRAQKIGIVATHAKCEGSGGFYITGGRKGESVGVHAIGVGSSERVSTREIEKIIATYSEPELRDMRMESRTEDGVSFILVHLPDHTFCFNETIAKRLGKTHAWTQLKSTVSGSANYRAINGVFDARTSRWVYGDKLTQKVGFLNEDVCTQYGTIVEWLLYTPFMKLDGLSIDKIELETVSGHTGTVDATVAFSITYDGVTYGFEWWTMYGLPNDYGKRFILRRLGICSDWIGFKFRGASESKVAFALMEVTYS